VEYGFLSYNPSQVAAAAPNTAIHLRSNASPASTLATMSLEEVSRLSTQATGAGMSYSTIEKLRRMLAMLGAREVYRENYMAVGNSMSFRDHPYLYANADGSISIEYPCARDWRANVVGKTTPLVINPADPTEHGDTVIGTITHGWDEGNACPADVLTYDREHVMELLQNAGSVDSEVYRRLEAGLDPDVSTEYYCRHENARGRTWQRDFRPIRTCLVDRGNCPSGQCDFTPAPDAS
jgi:hypothetical protein